MTTRQENPAAPTRDEPSLAQALEPLRRILQENAAGQRQLDSRVQAALTQAQLAIQNVLDRAVRSARESAGVTASPRASVPPPQRPAPPPEAPVRSAEAGVLRSRLLTLHGAFGEIDRLSESDKILEKIWSVGAQMPLRLLLLEAKSRALKAEAAHGFANFEDERSNRLKKVILPFDPDGIFMAASTEKSVYSGPRPTRGFPVDLTLVLGKTVPLWTLIIPFPHRARWGRLLYVEADGSGLDDILLLEAVARCAVSQMRAGQMLPHRPADKLRAFKDATIRERKRKAERARAREQKPLPARGAPQQTKPATTVEREAALQALRPPDDALDASGRVRRPLRPAEILTRVGDLPPMPHVSSSLLALLEDPDTSMPEITSLVAQDPSLSGRLLSVANSSFYGASRGCDSLPEAVMRLGFATIRSWILAKVTREVMVGAGPGPVVRMLWERSLHAALAAQLLSEVTGAHDPDSAFVAGMMHNLGLLLLARNHPVAFEELATRVGEGRHFYEVERELLGFDHATSGGLLMKKWGLGTDLVRAVSTHHELGEKRVGQELAALVNLAEHLVAGPPPGPEGSLPQAATILGLDESALGQIRESLKGRTSDPALFDD